ncbi:hypothetical protein [Legionella fallonii]|uniref:Secreted protein n=1 Tax=Legionella fallonii LLAP-10 TaxID=1212491 RepID=A0A098G4F1_9GAMM|nr:hypothetical protein [Legionella fallonii]CEG56355.1 conserved exported protein of unknown function [Legionella fallonii LLAP-10]
MMRKNIIAVFLFVLASATGFAAINSSVVPLSGGGNVAANTSVSISLNGVVPSVTYNVVCYIDTSYPFQYVLLGSSFTDTTSTIISYSLNGNYVMQDQLIPGHNIAVIAGKFTNPSTGYIVFTNLDQTNPFNVNNCFAIPIQA